jgi:hypothetical protein
MTLSSLGMPEDIGLKKTTVNELPALNNDFKPFLFIVLILLIIIPKSNWKI